ARKNYLSCLPGDTQLTAQAFPLHELRQNEEGIAPVVALLVHGEEHRRRGFTRSMRKKLIGSIAHGWYSFLRHHHCHHTHSSSSEPNGTLEDAASYFDPSVVRTVVNSREQPCLGDRDA